MIFSVRSSKKLFLSFDGKEYSSSETVGDFCDFDSKNSINIERVASLCAHIFDKNETLKKNIRSFVEAKINPVHFEQYDLLNAETFDDITKAKLSEYNEFYEKMKNNIIFNRAVNYYKKIGRAQYELLEEISRNKIYLHDGSFIRLKYNDTRTGRLSCEGKTNLYTMKSDDREAVVAKDNFRLVKFDFIACQVRLFLFLIKNDLYESIDPYEEISKMLGCDRTTSKNCCIARIFGAKKRSLIEKINEEQYEKLMKLFPQKTKIYEEHDGFAFNLFERPVKIKNKDIDVVNNNILQSIERDILLIAMRNVLKHIELNKIRANILFPFHDAFVMMIQEDELSSIEKIKEIFENSFEKCTMFSKVKTGKTLKEIA